VTPANRLPHLTCIVTPAYQAQLQSNIRLVFGNLPGVAWWRNGRALDLQSRDRGFDSRVGAQLRNDRGQVAHTRLPRCRQSSLLYGVVKPGIFTFTYQDRKLKFHESMQFDRATSPFSLPTRVPDWSAGGLLRCSAARLSVRRVVLRIPRARHSRLVADILAKMLPGKCSRGISAEQSVAVSCSRFHATPFTFLGPIWKNLCDLVYQTPIPATPHRSQNTLLYIFSGVIYAQGL